MMAWMWWQWALFVVPNVIIAVSYFYIPFRLGKKTDITKEKNQFLFKAFIVACGIHHLLHPLFMYLMPSVPAIYWPLISIEWTVAFISLLAAKEAEFG